MQCHYLWINECLQAHPTATERAQSTDMRTSSRFSLLPTFEIQLGVAPQCDGSKPSNRQLKELRGTQNSIYFGGPDAQAFLQHYASSANELYSFLVAQDRSGSTQVFLSLENNGNVPAEVQFLFPSQLRPPRENWLEMAYISETTKEQIMVEEAEIFEIAPRICKLACGGSVRIRILCRHHVSGHHKLPVRIRITNGRELVFMLKSLTLEPGIPHLQPLCESLTLPPISLQCMQADRKGVLQSFQLQNPSEVPVRFRVTGIKPILNEGEDSFSSCDSYSNPIGADHPLIQLQTTEDTILPGGIATISWIFRPMESREYKLYKVRNISASYLCPLILPWQCLFLSEKLVDCGLTAVHNSAHSIMFMNYRRSVSAQEEDEFRPASFQWEPLLAEYAKDCTVEPSEGIIELGQTMKITFHVHGGPAPKFFDMDFVCKIVPQPIEDAGVERHLARSEKRKPDKKPVCGKQIWPLAETQVVTVTARSLSYDEMKREEAWIAPPPLPHDDQLVTAQDHQRDLECSPEVCGNVLSEMLASLLGEKHFLATLASAAFSPEKNPDCQDTVIDDPVPLWRQIRGNRQELDLFGDSECCREPPTTPVKVKEEGVPGEQTAVTEELNKSLAEYTRADINLDDSEWQDLTRKFKSCADCRLICEGTLRTLISDLCTAEKRLKTTDSLDANSGHGIVLPVGRPYLSASR
ncbi:hypothetical protein SprV_0200924400 [Sparganum proliferum]